MVITSCNYVVTVKHSAVDLHVMYFEVPGMWCGINEASLLRSAGESHPGLLRPR